VGVKFSKGVQLVLAAVSEHVYESLQYRHGNDCNRLNVREARWLWGGLASKTLQAGVRGA
jgi:hypothetical protein